MTSIFFTAAAGIIFSTCEGFCESMGLGLPSTYTLKADEPLTVMLSWPSTVTIGTLRSMSSTVEDCASASACTSYDILSASIFTIGLAAVTVTPLSSSES